jgi:hypothetical protein
MAEKGESLLSILDKNREAILLAELGALLHDADKATYRWFLLNPALHDLKPKIRADQTITKSVKEIKLTRWSELLPTGLDKEISFSIEGGLSFPGSTVKKIENSRISSPFVYHHHNDQGEFPLLGIIVNPGGCGADGIDSELDKDGGIEQKGILAIDTPFGYKFATLKKYESNGVDPLKVEAKFKNEQDVAAVENEITDLESNIKEICEINDWWKRLLKAEKFLKNYLGATNTPLNDVTLWAHGYSVATLAKATLVKIIIESAHSGGKYNIPQRLDRRKPEDAEELKDTPDTTDFTFLRIYFDRYYLLSRAQRALDVLAANHAIETLQERMRSFISTGLLVGNEVYHDEEMQVFCIPRLATRENRKDNLSDLHSQFTKEVEYRCRLKIEEILKSRDRDLHELPFEISFAKDEEDVNVSQRILKRSAQIMKEPPDLRQSSALLADIKPGANTGQGRCEVCGLRFVTVKDETAKDKPKKDKDDRLCEVCAKRRSDAGKERAEGSKKCAYLTSDLAQCLPSDATRAEGENKLVLISLRFDISAIRDGNIFEATTVKKNADKPRKNPSPGRLYRCWETLREFTGFLFEEKTGANGEKSAPILALTDNRPVFRVIQSPKSLQFVASARHAAEIVDKINDEYEKQFGKFRAVLPMSIGCVFFHDKFPLYVVLEAAKLMKGPLSAGDFKRKKDPEVWSIEIGGTIADKSEYRAITLKTDREGYFGGPAAPVTWQVPRLLSDGRKDDFHPRFKLSNALLPKHVDDLAKKDSIYVRDGRFDFIFLDSAVRRFDILPHGIRNHAYGERPSYPLSAWRNFQRLRALLRMLSDTQIKHIEQALTDKMHAWREQWRAGSTPKPWENTVIKRFCEMALFAPNAFGAKKFSDESSPDRLKDGDPELLTNAAVNGMLLDAIDFYVRLTGEIGQSKKNRDTTDETIPQHEEK